jgi:hypothetical protein
MCELDAGSADVSGFTHLAVLANAGSTHENNLVLDADLAFFGTDPQNVWIGLSNDNATGDFEWVTTEQPALADGAQPWAAAQPTPGSDQCAFLSPVTGLLSAIDCARAGYAMCECDGYVADPTRF